MSPEEVPQELIDMMDEAAGRQHSRSGSVVATLARILTRHEEMMNHGAAEEGARPQHQAA